MMDMTKMQIGIFIVLFALFGIIFFTIQSSVSSKSMLSPTPNPLPTGSEYLQLISPAGQSQAQQQAQAQAQAQAQQQAAQQAQAAQDYTVQEPLEASISATIKTSKGDIKVSLFGTD